MQLREEIILKKKLTGHRGSIYCLCPDHKGDWFYSGGGEGWIVEWSASDPGDGKLIAEVEDQVFSLVQLPQGRMLVAGGFSGSVYFIDRDQPEQTRNLRYHQYGVFDLLLIEGELWSAGGDGKIGIWNLEKQDMVESLHISHDRLRSLRLSPNGEMLAVASSDNNIYLLHVPSRKILDVIDNAHDNSVFDVEFDREGQTIFSGGRDAHLKQWSWMEESRLKKDLNAHWYTINSVIKHPSMSLLATGSRDKTIRIWNTQDLKLVKTLDAARHGGHINSVNALMWGPEGRYLFSGSDDRTIIVWELEE